MSALAILTLGILITITFLTLMLFTASMGNAKYNVIFFVATLLSCIWIPFYISADARENEARTQRMEQTCRAYGGVATQFGDETGSGKNRQYHRLYMCKEGPRIIYER